MYWLAPLVGITAAVLLVRLFLIQVRKLLEEAAGVVRTWRTVRQYLAWHPGSTEGRVRRPEPQAQAHAHAHAHAQRCVAESDRTPLGPELP